MRWTASWSAPIPTDAINHALIRIAESDDGAARIPPAEVTPHVMERLYRICSMPPDQTEGEFECGINDWMGRVRVSVHHGPDGVTIDLASDYRRSK